MTRLPESFRKKGIFKVGCGEAVGLVGRWLRHQLVFFFLFFFFSFFPPFLRPLVQPRAIAIADVSCVADPRYSWAESSSGFFFFFSVRGYRGAYFGKGVHVS